VSENPSADDSVYTTVRQYSVCFILALLLLRMCIGWHFFAEGTKKLSYNESRQEWSLDVPTEMVFGNATGPFADLYKSQLPGFYDWENLLAVPRQAKPLTGEEIAKRQAWIAEFNAKVDQAKKDKQPAPVEIPEFAPYQAWAERILSGFRARLKHFTDLPGTDEAQDEAAAAAFVFRQQQLADFLDTESDAIAEYQHQLWRLENMETEAGADEIPFRAKRLAEKQAETKGLGRRLVSEVQGIERGFNDDLRDVLTADQRSNAGLMSRVESTLTNPKARNLYQVNRGVTCLIIGVGVCLLLGLFTRLAAVGGILFLLSVMATQLPWVAGAKADFFYYQLVEVAALLTLLASSPWRLPSLDGLLRGLFFKKRTS